MMHVPITIIMRRSFVFHAVCWVRLVVRKRAQARRYFRALVDGKSLDMGMAERD